MLLHNWTEIWVQPLSYTISVKECTALVRLYIDWKYEDISIVIDKNKPKTIAVHEAVQLLYKWSEILEDKVIEEPVFENEVIIAEE